jgi:K+ transporter
VVWTWVRGAKSLARATRKDEAELDWLVRKLDSKPPHRVPGTAVFLTGDPDSAPTSLMHNLKHNRVLHERNIILTIKTEDVPRVARHERIEIDRVADTFSAWSRTTASWRRRAFPRSSSTAGARTSTSTLLLPPSSCRDGRSSQP